MTDSKRVGEVAKIAHAIANVARMGMGDMDVLQWEELSDREKAPYYANAQKIDGLYSARLKEELDKRCERHSQAIKDAIKKLQDMDARFEKAVGKDKGMTKMGIYDCKECSDALKNELRAEIRKRWEE